MKKVTKIWVTLVLCAVLLIVSLVTYKVRECHSSQMGNADLIYLESAAPELIQEYMDEREEYADLLSCHVFTQNNHVFAFFDYKPLEGNPCLGDMPQNVVDRNLFCGFAKIEKNLGNYRISDFSSGNYDPVGDRQGITKSEHVTDVRYCYGKVIDNHIDKIEFYIDGIFAAAVAVGDKDHYFVELSNNIGRISCRFYGKENELLYEQFTS